MKKQFTYPKLDSLREKAKNSFILPDGYFELAHLHIDIKKNDGGLSIPNNYWETLEQKIRNKTFEKFQVMSVPEYYFEELSNKVFKKIKEEENTPNQHGFSIPPDYFETLSEKIIRQTFHTVSEKENNKIRIVPLLKHSYLRVAAGVALLLGLGSLIYVVQKEKFTINPTSDLVQKDITHEEYLAQQLSEEEIIGFLDNEFINQTPSEKENTEKYLREYAIEDLDIQTLGESL